MPKLIDATLEKRIFARKNVLHTLRGSYFLDT
jgi:hypothetical protein